MFWSNPLDLTVDWRDKQIVQLQTETKHSAQYVTLVLIFLHIFVDYWILKGDLFFLSLFTFSTMTTIFQIQTNIKTRLESQLRPRHCTNVTLTHGDKLLSDQYSFLQTVCTLRSRGEWIFLGINDSAAIPSSSCPCVFVSV